MSCRWYMYFSTWHVKILNRRKWHSMFKHWIGCIRHFGAPYLYSAEANEEFHKIACKVCSLYMSQISGVYLADICALQWSYKLTNKKDQEDQMVDRITEYDGMAYMAQTVPDLMLTTTKSRPAIPVPPNYTFPGICEISPRYLLDIYPSFRCPYIWQTSHRYLTYILSQRCSRVAAACWRSPGSQQRTSGPLTFLPCRSFLVVCACILLAVQPACKTVRTLVCPCRMIRRYPVSGRCLPGIYILFCRFHFIRQCSCTALVRCQGRAFSVLASHFVDGSTAAPCW